MASHGELVSDESKMIRPLYDEEGNQIRILLYEDWYDLLKPIYSWYQKILGNGMVRVGICEEFISEHLDRLIESFHDIATPSIKYGPLILSFALVSWAGYLVQNSINIGKFTYEAVGRYGEGRYGEFPYGGGTQLVEFPVE